MIDQERLLNFDKIIIGYYRLLEWGLHETARFKTSDVSELRIAHIKRMKDYEDADND